MGGLSLTPPPLTTTPVLNGPQLEDSLRMIVPHSREVEEGKVREEEEVGREGKGGGGEEGEEGGGGRGGR